MRIFTRIKFVPTQTSNCIYVAAEIIVPSSSRDGGEIGGVVKIVWNLILRAARSGNGIVMNGICYGRRFNTIPKIPGSLFEY